ncbi:unnamed protein product, partial [Laminaria digitata]
CLAWLASACLDTAFRKDESSCGAFMSSLAVSQAQLWLSYPDMGENSLHAGHRLPYASNGDTTELQAPGTSLNIVDDVLDCLNSAHKQQQTNRHLLHWQQRN